MPRIMRPHPCIALGIALLGSTSIAAQAATPSGSLVLTGMLTEGDAPNRFSEIIDLKTGFSKQTQQMGESESHSGFDGQPWGEGNGIVAVSNLPLAVARAATFAWIDQQGWRERMPTGGQGVKRVLPPHGNPVTLEFDAATGLPRHATIDGDWGPILVSFSDWRKVGPFTYPFRQERISPVGEHTIIQVESAKLAASPPKSSFSPPKRISHAVPLPDGVASVPFKGAGVRKTHILVDSMINGKPALLVFDTGGANYLSTDWAPDFNVHPSGGVNLSGVGETSSQGGYAKVDRIALGGAALRNETIVVGPSFFPTSNGKRADAAGLTGYEFLAEYVTTLDYPGQQLHFSTALPKEPHALRVPFYNDGSHMYVRAKVDGVDGLFGLDTGDGGNLTIFPAFASRNAIQGASGAVAASGGGMGGDVKSQPGVLKRFSLGGLNFDRLPVSFSHQKTGAFGSKSLAGNLGGGVLQCFRITIDFPHHLLLFDPAPKSPTCTPGGKVSRIG